MSKHNRERKQIRKKMRSSGVGSLTTYERIRIKKHGKRILKGVK